MDSHVFENGFFDFQTDRPFNRADSTTWPTAFNQQKPATVTYRSQEIGLFVQGDWRVGQPDPPQRRPALRHRSEPAAERLYGQALDNPNFAGLERFIKRDRGTDTNNLQPRLGATWDSRGDGRFIVRGGWGMYVTRNRPWFQLRSMNQFASSAVRISATRRAAELPGSDGGARRSDSRRVPRGLRRAATRHASFRMISFSRTPSTPPPASPGS